MIAKIFHRLTSGSVYFKPYFHSSYTSIARFYGQLRKAIHPLTSYFHVMRSSSWRKGTRVWCVRPMCPVGSLHAPVLSTWTPAESWLGTKPLLGCNGHSASPRLSLVSGAEMVIVCTSEACCGFSWAGVCGHHAWHVASPRRVLAVTTAAILGTRRDGCGRRYTGCTQWCGVGFDLLSHWVLPLQSRERAQSSPGLFENYYFL